MKIIGIDPGLDGGITIMIDGNIINMISMPTIEEVTKKKLKSGKYAIRRHIDAYKLSDIIFSHKDATVFIEKVNPFFGMSSASSSRMALSIGRIEGVLIGMGFMPEYVSPGVWQKRIWKDSDKVYRSKVDKKTKQGDIDTKKTSLNAARRIFPNANFVLKGKKIPHDGLFDSALIAEYGRKILIEEGSI